MYSSILAISAFCISALAHQHFPKCPARTVVFTGGQGSYNTETDQVISFWFPTQSKASSVISVDFYNTATGDSTFAAPTYGMDRANFRTGTPDKDVAIGVKIPSATTFTAGEYIYRLYIRQDCGSTCIADSNAFQVNTATVYQCKLDESKCSESGRGFQQCTKGPVGLTWGILHSCGNNGCLQEGNKARCAVQQHNPNQPSMPNREEPECDCEIGAMQCVGTGFRQCVPQLGGGRKWSITMACSPGTICQQEATQISCGYPKPTLEAGSSKCHTPDNSGRCDAQSQEIAEVILVSPSKKHHKHDKHHKHHKSHKKHSNKSFRQHSELYCDIHDSVVSKCKHKHLQYFPPTPLSTECQYGEMECYGPGQWRQCIKQDTPNGTVSKWGDFQRCNKDRTCRKFKPHYV